MTKDFSKLAFLVLTKWEK